MRLPCEVIRDLLPLYTENMLSPESRRLTDEHLAECGKCRALSEQMGVKAPDVQFRVDTAQEFARYEKKKNRKLAVIVCAVCMAVVIPIVLFYTAVVGASAAFLYLSVACAEVEVDTDPAHYSMYMGKDAKKEYRIKWEMDESIFPKEITADMEVVDYEMAYYDPWDAQYLSYLTVTYSSSDYADELDRLGSCGVMPYVGYYGVTGFADSSDPIAMYSDEYNGFVYAIHTPDKENTITYVELIFCNYCFDIDYEPLIPSEYLPLGFDAKPNNPYRDQKMKGMK